jgi:hypothetical protein
MIRPLPIAGLAAACLMTAAAARGLEVDRRIDNGHLSVAISARDGGAVCSLVHDGQELVNDHDHGRQLQYAWIYNDLGEPYNPTEAGADLDQMKPTSTTKVLDVRSTAASLTTVCQPAYWFTPGRHPGTVNTAPVTKDILTKTITLGHQGDRRVAVLDARVAVATEPTGPAVTGLRIEAPTIYAHAVLTEHALFDVRTGEEKPVPPPKEMRKDQMNTRINRVTEHWRVPLLSSADGRHALALYTPRAQDYWGAFTWDVPSDDPTNACTKLTLFFKHPVQAGKAYEYRTFLVVGTAAQVKESLRALGR